MELDKNIFKFICIENFCSCLRGAEQLCEVYADTVSGFGTHFGNVTNLTNLCVLMNRIVYNQYNSNIQHMNVAMLYVYKLHNMNCSTRPKYFVRPRKDTIYSC